MNMERGSKRVQVQKFTEVKTQNENGSTSIKWIPTGSRPTTSVIYTCPFCKAFVYQCMNSLITPTNPVLDVRPEFQCDYKFLDGRQCERPKTHTGDHFARRLS